MSDLQSQLQAGMAALSLTLSEAGSRLALDYCQLLAKWNHHFNLTAISQIDEMIIKHLLDSFAVVPYIRGKRIIDVGTGAGLPGIPLAIYYPELSFTLLDSNAKKTRFLTQCKSQLALANVLVENARVEQYQPVEPFDCVISRAFASLSDIISKTRHLCSNDGVILAMKGQYPYEELAAVQQAGLCYEVAPLVVPGLNAARHIVTIFNGE